MPSSLATPTAVATPTSPTGSPRTATAAPVCETLQVHPEAVAAALAAAPDATTVARMAEIFKALADPTRLHILLALAGRELCVCDLCSAVGLSQSAVSHQLRTLRQLHLVRSRRDGKLVFYALDDDHVRSLCEQTRAHLTEAH